MNVPHGRR